MSDQAELHAALLRLGGRIPDAMLVELRLRLADTGTVLAPRPEDTTEPAYTFAPALPDPQTFGAAVPPLLDLVGRDLTDQIDHLAIRAARGQTGAVALWRSWRTTSQRASSAVPPTRVYVLEATGPQAAIAAAMIRALAADLDMPQVEVYRSGADLPPYARAARSSGALLWMADESPPPRIARVFDVVDADGARFESGHDRLDGADREQVAAYLEAGAPVLGTTGTLSDVVEPERGAVVPMSYRTDGRWLWTESVTYYLRTHALAPEPDLLAHVRAAGALLPAPDAAHEHRALAMLFQSAAFVPAGDGTQS
ncbi:hypothetical protein HCB17_17260 [Salinispora arenicola]|uniref:hypothetical protein n=1 Tax=Salinispora arenicola TaxID=168697 RepID=UPI001430C49C|nr:hypothetical protein [Salinispora arenicola]NIL42704.1 hypothetical protein [Salinispora arenicola]